MGCSLTSRWRRRKSCDAASRRRDCQRRTRRRVVARRRRILPGCPRHPAPTRDGPSGWSATPASTAAPVPCLQTQESVVDAPLIDSSGGIGRRIAVLPYRWVAGVAVPPLGQRRAASFDGERPGNALGGAKLVFEPGCDGGARCKGRSGKELHTKAAAQDFAWSAAAKNAPQRGSSRWQVWACVLRGEQADQKRQNAGPQGAQEGRKRRGFAKAAALVEVCELSKSRVSSKRMNSMTRCAANSKGSKRENRGAAASGGMLRRSACDSRVFPQMFADGEEGDDSIRWSMVPPFVSHLRASADSSGMLPMVHDLGWHVTRPRGHAYERRRSAFKSTSADLRLACRLP
jgi:hypothetical protein